ncbi:MAG: hypothetical protein KDB25_09845 [Leucobacter sp.]|nr:hypothetical protein [Leucobacter sp.]
MSTWRDPVGPEGKNVYVRRRILVLVILLAIVAAVVLIIVKPGSSGGAATNPEVEIPAEVTAADQEAEEAKDDEPKECAAKNLSVVAITDRESYAAGEKPKLSLSVTNVGKKACSADLGTAGMIFAITSGSDRVWVSTDCQEKPDHRPVLLKPGKPLKTETISWDRTRSSPESCDVPRDPVTAEGASYHLGVAVAGVESDTTKQFLLY